MKVMLQALELLKLWNKSSLKGTGASYKENTGCRESLKYFILHCMSLLRALIFKISHFLAEIYLKHVVDQTSNLFNSKIGPQWKDWKSSKDVKQILSLLCNFVTLILDENYVKGHRVIKILKQIKFEGEWGELEAKYCFQRELEKYIYI